MKRSSTRRRPYSEDMRKLALSQLAGAPESKECDTPKSAYALSQDPTFPSQSTLKRWRQASKHSEGRSSKRRKTGPKSKLGANEKLIIVGWTLDRLERREPTTAKHIIEFAVDNFDVLLSPATVSRMMNAHKMTSHRSAPKESKYFRKDLQPQLLKFLRDFRKEAQDVDPSRVVAVDVAGFSNATHVLRTYSPQGLLLR